VLSIVGEEFYGLCGSNDFENSAVPNSVWVTKQCYLDSSAFKGYLVFHTSGRSCWHVIKLLEPNEPESISPVYALDIHEGYELSKVSSSFTEFACRQINEAREYW
jgi:hypothetical protein